MLLASGLLSCGSSSSQNLNGTWQFTVSSGVLANTTYQGNATLSQSGNTISGTINFVNDPCATTTGSITGTVTGLNVTLQVGEGSQEVTMDGTINSTFSLITGNYTAPGGGCLNGDYGSWSASLD